MLQSREAGCFWCPPSFPFPYSAHSIAYKAHISQYPIPSTQLKLSPYVLTHPYLTPSHQDTFTSTPLYPNCPIPPHPNSTCPILSHSTSIHSNPFLPRPPHPTSKSPECSISHPLNPTPNHCISLNPIPFHSTTHPNPPQFILYPIPTLPSRS